MRVFGRVLLAVLLIGAIGALGFGVWNSGYQQGLTETVQTTADVVVAAPYYPGLWGFGLIFKLFFAFLLFGLIFKLIIGRRYWRSHRGGDVGYGPPRAHMEERMRRWHDEAHGTSPPEDPS